MAARRIELGLEGGAVLRVTMDEADLEQFTRSLSGEASGWTQMRTDDSVCWVDLGKVTFTRVWNEKVRNVGFRGD